MRRHSVSFASAEQPMSDLNITPLIDVMLVLLIMFIIIIPVVSHKVTIDLPNGPTPAGAPPTIHRLNLDPGGTLSWNGRPVSEASLPARLGAMREDLNAELHFSADGAARYEDYDRVLAEIKRAGITQLGLVGNDRFEEAIDR